MGEYGGDGKQAGGCVVGKRKVGGYGVGGGRVPFVMYLALFEMQYLISAHVGDEEEEEK